MKITIYELLGLVKDGKAPKKIKYDNIIFEYDGIYYMAEYTYLDEYCDLSRVLNDTLEILEEKKIPEKLTPFEAPFLKNDEPDIRFRLIIDRINEICDYLNSKGE